MYPRTDQPGLNQATIWNEKKKRVRNQNINSCIAPQYTKQIGQTTPR